MIHCNTRYTQTTMMRMVTGNPEKSNNHSAIFLGFIPQSSRPRVLRFTRILAKLLWVNACLPIAWQNACTLAANAIVVPLAHAGTNTFPIATTIVLAVIPRFEAEESRPIE